MKVVVTMDQARKSSKVTGVFDTNLIYSRVTDLPASWWDIDFKDLLGHELATVTTSMFDNLRDIRNV